MRRGRESAAHRHNLRLRSALHHLGLSICDIDARFIRRNDRRCRLFIGHLVESRHGLGLLAQLGCLIVAEMLEIIGDDDAIGDVLGFGEGFRPDLGFLGHWLYLGDVAAIHIAEWESYTAHSRRLGIPVTVPAPGTGVLDHVAFNAPGSQHAVLEQRLRARGLAFHPHDTPDIGLRQIFLEDPNGLKLELNFWQRQG